MGFDIDRDFTIFEETFRKRPTIDREKFRTDLERFYVPYVEKLLKLPTPAIIGVSAIQGAGKSTQGEILELLLKAFGKNSVHLSIDDHYLTYSELNELRQKDPRYIRRGMTHDLTLAMQSIQMLKNMVAGKIVLMPQYDKSAFGGDGERFRWIDLVEGLTLKGVVSDNIFHLTTAKFGEEIMDLPENMGGDVYFDTRVEDRVYLITKDNFDGLPADEIPLGWKIIKEKPDFIFYDGWFLGARSVVDESVFDSGLPALEKPEDREFAKMINKKLLAYYPLWDLLDFLTVLLVPNYQMSLTWREDAEKPLQEKGEGMTPDQIREFVYYFWRSVHPAIQIKNLAHDSDHANQVVIVGDGHGVKEVLTPTETKEKYP